MRTDETNKTNGQPESTRPTIIDDVQVIIIFLCIGYFFIRTLIG